MKKIIYLGIADDHLVLRQGLVSLLKEYDNLSVIVDVNNGSELMDALKKNKPDVILLDIEMPVMDGREALDRIKMKYPNIKVIIMSMHFNDAYIIEFIKSGANAFLAKNSDIDKVVDAIYAVHEMGYYYDVKVSAAMAAMIKKTPIYDNRLMPTIDFTSRELDIMRLVCLKKNSQEIAKILNLSQRTVEGHRYNIGKKTNITNPDELAEFVTKNKIVNLS